MHIEILAEAEQIPANYLVQILNDLKTRGLIQSRRGKQGGYLLTREPREVTLAEIIRAVEGEVLTTSLEPSGQNGEGVAAAWREMDRAMVAKAEEISLAWMMDRSQGGGMYYI